MVTSKRDSKERQKKLNQAIAKWSRDRGLPRDLIRYQIAFEGFLERVFQTGSDEWVLKGGAALLMRNGEGRTTADIDLARVAELGPLASIEAEIRQIAQRPGQGPLTYRVRNVQQKRIGSSDGYKGPTYEVSLDAMMGVVVFQAFSLDLTEQRHTQEPHERVEVDLTLSKISSENLEPVSVYATAIESQLADKICAMREPHRSGDSNRYHDLADIITILLTQPFSAKDLKSACDHEARRRRIEIPTEMWVPLSWEKEYPRRAETYYGLPVKYHDFAQATAFASEVLNPAIAGELSVARWDPDTRSWR
ncbi:nucleotidyl transferase AbiEii/AbiGii toxin family protein [Corynebacterium coyleae]|uniref:nucleotidyl transferase AbiEii/AbiGii toxin family protein n=1 Tax=Corynebacterium coyleae TaxID=53374 RepID=UPI001CCBF242|nr:nucleotidyl transferase AbiEii/AbiGii toxin family protein [Corynebacterium coyleae]UBI09819.1 nucleotidyl transferase AbiEii/AbiGii toxin family protein [Corynebacterium coyleae]